MEYWNKASAPTLRYAAEGGRGINLLFLRYGRWRGPFPRLPRESEQ
jgi:hypothetical protein